jgi:chemosensory pili system protein ChpA (sensor histidine kinase/response regulator)
MKRILVVDDEFHVRRIVSDKLTKHGYTAVTADCGEDAMRQIEETVPDVIIADFDMPGMTGIELARKLYRHPRASAVPVLMISAREFEIGPAQLADTNIKHIEGKPFSVHALLSRVEDLIGPAELVPANV